MTEILDVTSEAFSQLASRGAIAGGASALVIATVLAWWWARVRRVHRDRQRASLVILVSGSRGKSSTVRLLHAALTAAGRATFAKTTGTAAAEIPPRGIERSTPRFGQVSVIEMSESFRRAMSVPPVPDALVMECMAVSPALIELVSQRMVQPNIVVITNVLLDHLEEEGGTIEQIAASLGGAITPGCLVVTGEQRPGPLSVLVNLAHHRGATLIQAEAAMVPDSIRERLSAAHTQNIALTLAVTRSLGIADDVAIEGMSRATHEPGAQEVWSRDLGPLHLTYTDLGAINDPQSLLDALHTDGRLPADGLLRIGVLIGRWDRPLRAMEFAGLMTPGSFDALLVTGGPVHAIRRVLLQSGWAPERVAVAVHFTGSMWMWRHRLTRLAQRIDPDAHRISLVSLENIHDGGADRLRSFCREGELAVTS